MSQPRPQDDETPAEEQEPSVLPWPGKPATLPRAESSTAIRPAAEFLGGAGQHPLGPVERELQASDFRNRPERRVLLPVFLFLATCASTFLAGAFNWQPEQYLFSNLAGQVLANNWQNGLIYMAAVIGILLTHEMGHFVQTVRYGVPASFPFFIPVPFLMTGTMGAVIGMEGSRADRKQLFDIGISGPWAGLIVALPIICVGILHADVLKPNEPVVLGDPLIYKMLAHYLRPDLAADGVLDKHNPLLMAGWVGMLITGLNMLPISQLDGGHVIYGLFGRKAHLVARTFMIVAILVVVFGQMYNWTLMLVLVIMLGVDHPPTRDDDVSLGFFRRVFGLVSLAIPVFCFTPVTL